jgi:hypothetical protein
MAFKKGQSGNPAGKKKGNKNKKTKLINKITMDFLDLFKNDDLKKIAKWCKEQPRGMESFLHFLGKIAPKQLDIEIDDSKNSILEALQDVKNSHNNTNSDVKSETD